jgi:hypothetical protein
MLRRIKIFRASFLNAVVSVQRLWRAHLMYRPGRYEIYYLRCIVKIQGWWRCKRNYHVSDNLLMIFLTRHNALNASCFARPYFHTVWCVLVGCHCCSAALRAKRELFGVDAALAYRMRVIGRAIQRIIERHRNVWEIEIAIRAAYQMRKRQVAVCFFECHLVSCKFQMFLFVITFIDHMVYFDLTTLDC